MADEQTGTSTPPTTNGNGTGTPEGQNAGGGTGTGSGTTGAQVTLSTAQLDERLERARAAERAKLAKEQADRDATAEQERLKKQGEYEKLAATAQKKVEELEPQLQTATQERDALREHVNGYITKQTKEWPADYRALVPEGDDALARWQAFERVQKVVPAAPGTTARPAGNPASPRPAGAQPSKTLVEQEAERLKGLGVFSRA